jgi:hypothetical protein
MHSQDRRIARVEIDGFVCLVIVWEFWCIEMPSRIGRGLYHENVTCISLEQMLLYN